MAANINLADRAGGGEELEPDWNQNTQVQIDIANKATLNSCDLMLEFFVCFKRRHRSCIDHNHLWQISRSIDTVGTIAALGVLCGCKWVREQVGGAKGGTRKVRRERMRQDGWMEGKREKDEGCQFLPGISSLSLFLMERLRCKSRNAPFLSQLCRKLVRWP